MIGIQCQSNDEVNLIRNVDTKLTVMCETTALAILEHMSYILRSLESQATSTDKLSSFFFKSKKNFHFHDIGRGNRQL